MANVIPVNKQIILKMESLADKTTVGGIIIPASVQEKPNKGTVYKSDHEEYKEGEIVLYRKYSGFEFDIEDDKYLVIEAGDVLVKVIE
jgi:chaperonin GroES